MSKPAIGSILDPTGAHTRDAIHVPIMPIEAAQELTPGAAVAVHAGRAVSAATSKEAVGIVDPFLPVNVKAGDRFYVWLRPQSTLRLWHEWTHPRIDGESKGCL